MSLEQDVGRQQIEDRYRTLKGHMKNVVSPVQEWADRATALHADVTDPAEKAEILALRDQLIADINAALGL